MPAERKMLGQILIDEGIIKEAQLREALAHQQKSGSKIGKALLELGYINQEQLTRALAKQFDLKVVDLEHINISPAVLDLVPQSLAKKHNIIPVSSGNGTVTIAVDDPMDFTAIDNLRFLLNTNVECVLATRQSIQEAIARYYGTSAESVDSMLQEFTDMEVPQVRVGAAGLTEGETEDAPIIRLVHLLLSEAVKSRASDIHIEPLATRLRIRYRVDGVCHEVESPPKRLQGALLSRVKLMAGMDIAEKRRPQDGRINIRIEGRDLDIRVSTLPATHGESLVMRILDKQGVLIGIEKLGFHPDDHKRFLRIIRRPNGIFLVTGPTGSGKTTTLYSALAALNRSDTKIVTVEDPVEYQIAGINQCEVKEQIGLTFANILRSMLRQAPDVILVGEIRDTEAADVAIQAALTGHLVFSTLHTNDAPSAITRLIDMGVKSFLVASSIQAVMAQRLVRRICPECKQEYEPEPRLLHFLGIKPEDAAERTFYRGAGCPHCKDTGYFGRIGIFELMEMNSKLRELAFRREPTSAIRKQARLSGMLTLQEDGVRKVFAGITTVEEVVRTAHRVEELEELTSYHGGK